MVVLRQVGPMSLGRGFRLEFRDEHAGDMGAFFGLKGWDRVADTQCERWVRNPETA